MSDAKIPSYRQAKREFERQYTKLCLDSAGGNVTQAARIADKDRKDFYDLMIRCGMFTTTRAAPRTQTRRFSRA